ncbi:hypothetical protein BH23CHL8_BH23CHL8_07490 [soil metagenome]
MRGRDHLTLGRWLGLALGGVLAWTSVALAPVSGEAAGASEPYRARRFALAADLRRNELSWTDEKRLGSPARKPRDDRGVPMVICAADGRRTYWPGALSINGMKRIDAFVETGDERQLEQARRQAATLRRIAIERRGAWWIPDMCDYPPEGQRAPWFDAMSQGLAVSFFVRLYRVTGHELHLDAARHVFRSFRRFDRSKGAWVSFVDARRYLWLEHYPLARPDHVLNAHLHAVFGIYEFWQVTGSETARHVLEGAITTMRDHAWRYRRPGGVSLYGLRHRETIQKYHEIHVWQLRLLARISGDDYFWRLAGRLVQDLKPGGYVPGRPQIVRRPGAQGADSVAGVGARALLAGMPAGVASLEPAARRARILDGPKRSADARKRRAAGIATAPDFNGDGFADLAVGAPFADVEHRDTGLVHVIHGSASGLRGAGRQAWSQASEGIADKPERGDQFGWTVAHGDFDGDGYSDLAISARWENTSAPDSGVVHILYGTATGLTATRSQVWHPDRRGIPGEPGRLDEFGWVMVAADFDGDGRDDLAIGAHHANVGTRDAGSVHILYGTAAGLSAQDSQVWHQASRGIADKPETGDGFGKALAAGDFDGDGLADLAIGAPYESRAVNRMGIVHILRGSRGGLTSRGSQVWHQDRPGILDHAEERDQFGQSLAAGDFDRDGFDDLVVGVWFEDYRNTLSNEGGFHVIYGSGRGLTAQGDQLWHQDRPGVRDRTQDSDRFGQALATADFDGDGFDDIAVGSPSSDLGKGIHQNRGAAHVFYGSRRGITADGDEYLTQDSPGVKDRSEAWDHFGETVGGADFDADGFDDLVVGIPWEDLEHRNDGAVFVVHGSRRGLDTGRDQLWGARGSSLPRARRAGGRLGWSVSTAKPGDGSPRTGRPRL